MSFATPDLNSLTDEDIDICMLPSQLKVMVRLVGVRETARFLEAYGGQHTTLPETASPDCKICKVISVESAQALVNYFESRPIYVPKLDKLLIQVRNQQIRAARGAGVKRRALAKQYGITMRQIGNICS